MRDQGHQFSAKSPLATAVNPVFGTAGTAPPPPKKSDELLQLNQTTEFAPGLEGKLSSLRNDVRSRWRLL